MDVFSSSEMAEAYSQICDVYLPASIGEGSLEFHDLPLVRSVDPRQHDYLEALSRIHGPKSEWAKVHLAVSTKEKSD